MKTSAFRSFLMVCLLALSSLAFADDAEIAGKLKGEWTGDWTIDKYTAKFVLIVTEVAGTNLKGEGQWYGTATGDTKSALKTAVVKDGELSVEQADGAKFNVKLDGDKIKGTWVVGTYTGTLTASRTKSRTKLR